MIDFYTSDTANGQKVALMLEETGLSYEKHVVDLLAGEHLSEPYLSINPAGQIPAIVDRDSADGEPLAIAQSMAIVRYLADKSGRFLPPDARARAAADQYMALVSADIGATFTGLFMFRALPQMLGDPPVAPAVTHYEAQADRLLALLDQRLQAVEYLDGRDYGLADILAFPVAATSVLALGEEALAPFPSLRRWRDAIAARPAARRVFG